MLVEGYVSKRCYNLSCHLVAHPDAQSAPMVSLEGGTLFEARLRELAGMHVLMRVTINKPAFYETEDGGLVVTSDRAPEVTPLEVNS